VITAQCRSYQRLRVPTCIKDDVINVIEGDNAVFAGQERTGRREKRRTGDVHKTPERGFGRGHAERHRAIGPGRGLNSNALMRVGVARPVLIILTLTLETTTHPSGVPLALTLGFCSLGSTPLQAHVASRVKESARNAGTNFAPFQFRLFEPSSSPSLVHMEHKRDESVLSISYGAFTHNGSRYEPENCDAFS
jgi:hypothetical protein